MDNAIVSYGSEWIQAIISAVVEIFTTDLGQAIFGLTFVFVVLAIIKVLIGR